MQPNIVLRRIIAYFIDVIIITFAASMLASISYLNPQLNSYNEIYDEYVEYASGDEEIDQEKILDFDYRLERNNLYGAAISITLTVLYFVVFQKYNGGQTLGKKITRLRIKDNPSLISYFIRSLILNNVFFNVLKVILILKISKSNYISTSKYLYLIELALEVGILLMVILRSDKRGLHDIIAQTEVVYVGKEENKCITA